MFFIIFISMRLQVYKELIAEQSKILPPNYIPRWLPGPAHSCPAHASPPGLARPLLARPGHPPAPPARPHGVAMARPLAGPRRAPRPRRDARPRTPQCG